MDKKTKELLILVYQWMVAANKHIDALYEKVDELETTLAQKVDKETF